MQQYDNEDDCTILFGKTVLCLKTVEQQGFVAILAIADLPRSDMSRLVSLATLEVWLGTMCFWHRFAQQVDCRQSKLKGENI